MIRRYLYVLMITIVLAPVTAYAVIPATINYQGYLTDANGVPFDGQVDMTFRIYNDELLGDPVDALWTEVHDTVNAVDVSAGVYSVQLGLLSTLTVLSFDGPYWLSIEVGTDGEMTPRQPLDTVPYAVRAASAETADDADMVDGQHASDFAEAVHQHGEYVTLDTSQTINGIKTFTGLAMLQGGVTTTNLTASGLIFGDGSGLTNINPANVAPGTADINITGFASDFSGTLSGDVTGTQSATTVSAIRGVNVSPVAPLSGNALIFNAGSGAWEPMPISGDWNNLINIPPDIDDGDDVGIIEVNTGQGLTGGPINTSNPIGAISIASGGVANHMLTNDSVTISSGTGLSGGGLVQLGGLLTLDVDTTQIQSRVTGFCPAGSSISAIDETGGVTCEPDDDTQVTSVDGLSGGTVNGDLVITGNYVGIGVIGENPPKIIFDGAMGEIHATSPTGAIFATDIYAGSIDATYGISGDGSNITNINPGSHAHDYAGSVTPGGPAITALSLDANGSNCPAGQYTLGVDASGNAEGCTVDMDTTYSPGTGINITGGVITNTGDSDAGDDLTISTAFAGDVTGTYDNLQIGAGAVGAAELQDDLALTGTMNGLYTGKKTSNSPLAGLEVVRSEHLILGRDGTPGGLRVTSDTNSFLSIVCQGITSANTAVYFQKHGSWTPGAPYTVFTDAQNIRSVDCVIGNAYGAGDMTHVRMFRYQTDHYWNVMYESTWPQL